MSKTKLKYRKMASAVRRATDKYYARESRSFADDPEMVEMFKDDRKLLREFAVLVNQGQITRAAHLIDDMDTGCYEVIPNFVYNYVNRSAYEWT